MNVEINLSKHWGKMMNWLFVICWPSQIVNQNESPLFCFLTISDCDICLLHVQLSNRISARKALLHMHCMTTSLLIRSLWLLQVLWGCTKAYSLQIIMKEFAYNFNSFLSNTKVFTWREFWRKNSCHQMSLYEKCGVFAQGAATSE